MHARFTTVVIKPEKIDEIISFIRDYDAAATKQQKGCKGLLYLLKRNTGKAIGISIWDTEADMIGSETSGFYDEQASKVEHLFAGPLTMEHYEVIERH
jgi:hypothetical protein